MARVTVEDCVEKVPNRFELVLLAAQRSRDVSAGAQLTLDRDNDKNPVVALREIAEETVPVESLQNAVVQGLQKHVEVDEPEEDDFDLLSSEISADLGDLMVADGAREDGANEDDLLVRDESVDADEDAAAAAGEELSGDEEI